MLSVIIPSYKDPSLHETINSVLENAEGEVEVIAVLDSYWPTTPIKEDKRIKIVHFGKNRGMRGAINAGVDVAKGEWLLRADEHNMFDKGFDVKLVKDCQPNWIITPRRYFLDPVKWERMDIPPVDHSKLVIQDCGNGVRKFTGRDWKSRNEATKDEILSETMAMQGSLWFMPHKWWDDVIGQLDTVGYGPLYQDSHEMVFKTWKAGGKLMLDRNTWHAHKHRSFPRTHSNGTKENPSNNEACWAYSLSVWEDYFLKEIKPKWKI